MRKQSTVALRLALLITAGVTACGNANAGIYQSSDTSQQSSHDAGADESFAHGLYITKEESCSDISSVEIINADEYYEANSDVISETKVEDSRNIQSEAELKSEFVSRGFTDFPIYAEYTVEGEYLGDHEIEGSSTNRPMYTTSYAAENGDLWTIISINGSTTATPVTYNFQSTLNAKLIFAESEAIESYDCYTGKFYTIVPDKSSMIVVVVDRIDSETLETLSIGEINRRYSEHKKRSEL